MEERKFMGDYENIVNVLLNHSIMAGQKEQKRPIMKDAQIVI